MFRTGFDLLHRALNSQKTGTDFLREPCPLLNYRCTSNMARGRIATPEEEEEGHDHQEESSRKKQRTVNGKKASTSARATVGGSDSERHLSEHEEATAAALRGWTVETFTDKPVPATKVVLQQVCSVCWRRYR